MNRKILFNDGWEFAKSSLDVTDYSGLLFEPVNIPHDWLIYNTLNLYEDSIGWYRKRFTSIYQEKELLLCFDGVYMDSSLYVNQIFIGDWKYGYSAFEHEITKAIVDGENEIVMKVVHQSPNSRWYSGAGIYRNVWLKTRDKNHIVTDGTYVTIEQQADGWQVEVDTEANIYEDVLISHSVMYKGVKVTASSEEIAAVENNPSITNRQRLWVNTPLLWSPEEPNLYQLITKLIVLGSEQQEQEVETITQNIGFRTIELDPNQGLLLNGKQMKLNGVCEHHDLGALGAAFNKTALRRRFNLLKEMGVNAIRTAHNMPAAEFMDLADEMGLLVVTEAFDMWERSKTPFDYARFFKEWVHLDIKSWVLRDRNHPSLLMWSIGNEIYDTHADVRGQEITRDRIICLGKMPRNVLTS